MKHTTKIEVTNIKLKVTQNDDEVKRRVAEATSRKKSVNETLEEAWQRIMTTKAYQTKRPKFDAVKQAMLNGDIGREPGSQGKRLSAAEVERLYKVLLGKQREQKLREMVDNTPANYELITTEERLIHLSAHLMAEDEVAVDTETTGVDVYTDTIVGMSFTLPTVSIIPRAELGWNVYIPVDHKLRDGETQLDLEYVLRKLRPFLHSDKVGKVLHNAIFDIAMFRRHGSDLKNVVWDTMTAMHLLNENEGDNGGSFKLKDLAPKYLGVESDTYDTLFGKTPFREVPLEVALVYAAKDTELTWRLYEFQRKHMEKMPTILEYYQTVEIPILYVIVDLEANGYILDLDFAREYGEKLHRRAEELSEKLVAELTPFHEGTEPINLNSPAQMLPAVSKAIGRQLPNMDAKKTLKPLKGEFEIIADLLEYKNVTKLSGTYIDALPTKQNPTTKRWHSRFNPMGTVTGRFSSGKDEEDTTGQGFNVQNQPEDARKMFVAPPGKVLVGADFKAQEIRCVAYMSGEPVLIDAFLTNRDPYAMMASTYYKRPYEEVYKKPDGSDTPERKKFKVVWLATLYGMSDFSLAEMLGTSKDDAVKFKNDIFGTMPKLSEWLEGNKAYVAKYGYVWADKQARKRRLPDAKLTRKKIPYGQWQNPKFEEYRKHNAKIGRAMRQATNARVQGSSSIQTKVTMLRAWEYCRNKPGWCLWATVHDELIFEIPDDFSPEEGEDIRRIMVDSYKWGDVVPNGTDVEVMYRWSEAVPLDAWFDGVRPDK